MKKLHLAFLISFSSLALFACGDRPADSGAGKPETDNSMAKEDTAAREKPAKEESADMDSMAREYVMLVLELGNHDDSYVDAYYGPEKLREQARASEATPAELAQRAQELINRLPQQIEPSADMEALRQHYLKTQLRAIKAHAESLAGTRDSSFESDARLLYDTQPPKRELAEFEPVLKELDQLLPGDEPLHLRVKQFKQQFEIPKDKLPEVFDAAIDACRERTKKYIQLPENEDFELEYVTDKPWSGYNWYQGNARSLIQVNTELPVMIDRAIDLGCHEGYPGHHTYNALLEQELVENRGWLEYSVYPLFSPQSLIAEGSANYGIELAFPGNDKLEFEKNVLYPKAGLDPADAEKYDRVLELTDRLSFAENEIARQYIDGEIDGDKVVELFQKYGLRSPERAAQRKRFVDTYGTYVINYNWGKQLVANYVEEVEAPEDRWERFGTLLSSPRLPSSLDW
ncbi:hypothetical protein [Microbulbifer yueqingensis]|uniref:DUF885 domain-containing protein n=1 Tax=Microbulbifer yueqingensis TaxID=658219 RepID=A0A1G9E2E7_9GAMM|nr:hypothetical protein [Microbulbifer yueqingensis]SDK70316.1 hypothetical protein SAMN05216212_2993 [Microbulbifer yueqingensis]